MDLDDILDDLNELSDIEASDDDDDVVESIDDALYVECNVCTVSSIDDPVLIDARGQACPYCGEGVLLVL